MMLLRQRPREVYRLYDEDEFLQAGAASFPSIAEPRRVSSIEREDRRTQADQRLRRLAGLAVLAGALGAVGGLVVMSGLHSVRGTLERRGLERRGAGRRPAIVRTGNAARAVSRAPEIGPSERDRSAGRVALASGGIGKGRSAHSWIGHGRRPGRPRAGAAARRHERAGRSSARAEARVGIPAVQARPAQAATGGEGDSGRDEFGFEGGAGT